MSSDPDRLWSRLVPNGECLEWSGARSGNGGYGRIKWEGRLWSPHRLAYMLVTGIDPGDLQVMHSCDNPPCCNFDHLSLGTRSENMLDCVSKGRLRPPAEIWRFECPVCGTAFERLAHEVRSNNQKQKKSGPYCGASCAARGSRRIKR